MHDDLQIVPATSADIEAVHQIEMESFPSPWRREFFDGELRADWRLNLVARRAETVVGYLFAMWLFDELHINKIAVAEEHRRKGIADTMMEKLFDFARENDIRTISLEVRRSNEGAQEFYRHLDFESSYLRPRYYPDGEAAVVMVRET